MLKEFQIAINGVEQEVNINRSRFICYLAPCHSNQEV